MTGNDVNGADYLAFKKSVKDCTEDLGKLLPDLSRRYDLPVILDAMANHVGSGLQAMRHRGLCDTAQVQKVIQQLECWAFNIATGPSEPAPDSTP